MVHTHTTAIIIGGNMPDHRALAELEALLATTPAAYFDAARHWLRLATHPLDHAIDRLAVNTHPRAWITISLQSNKPAITSVYKELCSSGAIASCEGVVRTAIEHEGHSQHDTSQAVSAPTTPKVSVSCCAHVSKEGAGAASLGVRMRMTRVIVCALSRRMSIDRPRTDAIIKLMRDNLIAGRLGAGNKRCGVIVLEPLRRLILLSRAAAAVGPDVGIAAAAAAAAAAASVYPFKWHRCA